MRIHPTLVVAIMLTSTATAVACSCVGRSDAQYRQDADVVFAGSATEQDDPTTGPNFGRDDVLRWTFAVSATVKGDHRPVRTVVTHRSSATCGFTFEVGRRYVVYAQRDDDGRLTTSLCSGTDGLGANDPPFAIRRVAVFGTYRGHLSAFPSIGTVRRGEHPGRGGIRLLLERRFIASGNGTAVPAGTKLVRYGTRAGIVRVVLSDEFGSATGARRRLALAQVVSTAFDLPGVTGVRIRTASGPLPGFDRTLTLADFASERLPN